MLMTFFKRFARATAGLSAIEFALVAPIMVSTYFGIAEVANYILAARKVASVASTAADLVAQDTIIDNNEMTDILGALNVILAPFNPNDAQIRVSSVVADEDGVTRVEWSDAIHTTPLPVNTPITLPQSDMVAPFQGIVMAEITFTYTTAFGEFLNNGATVTDRFYMKPRRSTKVLRVP